MSQLELPDKIYFKIGEVSRLLQLEPYVLRYWETEFEVLRPAKSKSGQRLYRRRDVEILDLVKDLLYRQKFTIQGARQHLRTLGMAKAMDDKTRRDDEDPCGFLVQVRKGIARLRERTDRASRALDSGHRGR